MRFCLLILLLMVLVFGGMKSLVYANPVMSPVTITEFSTDEDWIEISSYWFDTFENYYRMYINGKEVYYTLPAIESDYELVVLDQTNTSSFDLTDGYGSIEFTYSPELRYGSWGPVPAPPKHESAENTKEDTYNYSNCFRLTPFMSRGKPNSILNSAAYGSSDVVINEILPYDGSTGTSFIELYNRGEDPVDIGNWSVIAGSRYYIPSNTVLAPGEFWVLDNMSYPDGLMDQNYSFEGVVYIQDDEFLMLESVGWTEKANEDHSLIRYPDGFATSYFSYDTATAKDFRQSLPTLGSTNETLYPIKMIAIEEDSKVIYPGQSCRFNVQAIDENYDTFRIKPEKWLFNGNNASIDQSGLLTVDSYGKGTIRVEFEDFSDSTLVFGAISGRIENDLILNAEDGPYYIGSPSIQDDVTLTINPGTVLKYDGYNNAIYCDGRLSAIGTTENPIRFISTTDYSITTIGVYLKGYSSECIFENCIFEDFNKAFELGYNKSAIISNCTFRNNISSIYILSIGNAIISNCLMLGNQDSFYGIYSSYAHSVKISNNIFIHLNKAMYITDGTTFEASNNIINNCSDGIYLRGQPGVMLIHHNNIWNTNTPFSGDTGALGTITTHNTNGIPCDRYFNISADPLFANPEAGDFRLCAGSPCIDAGDPSILDDDGTISDIGYVSGEPPVGIMAGDDTPKELALGQNNPNPFNASTTIAFTLPVACRVTLDVYSIAGQKVARLVDSELDAGSHHTTFDGAGLPSGIYLTRLIAGGRTLTGKMMMVK